SGGGGSGHLYRNGIAGAFHHVTVGQIHQPRCEIDQFRAAVAGVGADNHTVAGVRLVGGGTVDGNHFRAFLGANGVGGETLTIVHVVNLDLFVFEDARQIEQFAVNGAGSFILEF